MILMLQVSVAHAMAPEEDGVPTGPFDVTPEEFESLMALGKKIEAFRRNTTQSLSPANMGESASLQYHKQRK
jgi:hypothetical protein